jgi:hypothetical protein
MSVTLICTHGPIDIVLFIKDAPRSYTFSKPPIVTKIDQQIKNKIVDLENV